MDGCLSGWADEVSSANFTPSHPTSHGSRRSSVAKCQRHPSCGLLSMAKHTRNDVQGAGQIQEGSSRGRGLGKAHEMELEES